MGVTHKVANRGRGERWRVEAFKMITSRHWAPHRHQLLQLARLARSASRRDQEENMIIDTYVQALTIYRVSSIDLKYNVIRFHSNRAAAAQGRSRARRITFSLPMDGRPPSATWPSFWLAVLEHYPASCTIFGFSFQHSQKILAWRERKSCVSLCSLLILRPG